ncbi:CoA pyrophosphatase [Lacihabitans sp. CCS-44]|uniref:NUDIX hydrolase n=1 Tax=Lacihabitans sp. CCS-44 TaxID=2487331 RepID=UPI0020CDED48|nr:CoA pyrophosphatase [Lacihabitans sp. CCS-44]
MYFEPFINSLSSKLKGPLPGVDFQRKFMHEERLMSNIKPNETTRQSAVLVAFYPSDGDVFLPLILRPAYDGTHGGQMALPGGKMEYSDENLVRTALREAQEEIGVKAMDVNILGELTDVFIPVSNFIVKPIVGYLDYKPDFFPDKKEVEKIFEVEFSDFLKLENKGTRNITVGKRNLTVPGFDIQNQWIWGATALIINEVVEIVIS